MVLADVPGSCASLPQAELDALIALFGNGRMGDVIEQCERLVARYPQSVYLYNLLGAANGASNRFERAIACFQEALQIRPDYAQAHNNLGLALKGLGRRDEAIASYERALQIKPDDAEAHYNLGLALQELGRSDAAIASYEHALQIKPDFAVAHNNLGLALQELGRRDEAIASYERALQIKPDYAEAHYNLGLALQELGRSDAAIASYEHALQIKPDFAVAHNNLGLALQELGRRDEAIASYERALQIKPDDAEAHYNLGLALQELGRSDAAIASYEHALQIKPDFAVAHNNLGLALQELGRRDEAIASYERALQVKPDFAVAHHNLGVPLQELGRRDEAIASYERALQIKPDFDSARAQKLHQQAHICDWDAIYSAENVISILGMSGNIVFPFDTLSLEDHPERQKLKSERFAAHKFKQSLLPALPRTLARPGRLRIGYFSADFHEHPVMYLMARLFELHDREQFSIHAFSFGPDRHDAMRARLTAAFDQFHGVRGVNDEEVARLARAEEIDVAVDLMGYTADSRPGIFMNRAAPIQISYLGYPGTSGAPHFDYLIADRMVIPESHQRYYSERIIYLPASFMVNDDSRLVSSREMTRVEMDLPEHAFVFCSFNNSYKVTPTEFDIWMCLLKRVDGSVLWLAARNERAISNLRAEAQKRGVDAARLVFARRVPMPDHLARHRLADLFLDTFNYNAHSTASDALWAGLPVLTRMGEGFAARVGGSLLNALGLPELITTSAEDYERLALELATQPDRLKAIRDKLAERRMSAPLFDSERFVRRIEHAYQLVWQRYLDGQEPDVIDVPDRVFAG